MFSSKKDSNPLFLVNNGQRFALHFDCRNCEMTVIESQSVRVPPSSSVIMKAQLDIWSAQLETRITLNGIRRSLAAELDLLECGKKDILLRKPRKVTKALPQKDITYKNNISNHISEQVYKEAGAESIEKAYELDPVRSAELMRTKYCIRFELGMCPVHQGAKASGPLFLLNNGRRFALHFDCKACEMTLIEA